MRFVNGVITEIFDPKILYSRFSFLESGKEAIDKKFMLAKSQKSKKTDNSYYFRSALVKNLIPAPAEGKVRALFNDESTKNRLANAARMSLMGNKSYQIEQQQ